MVSIFQALGQSSFGTKECVFHMCKCVCTLPWEEAPTGPISPESGCKTAAVPNALSALYFFALTDKSGRTTIDTSSITYPISASSGKKNKFGYFLVVVQLIHRLTQSDISLYNDSLFPLLAYQT